jgi:uncharacterized delta-60 repeat protein
LDLVSQPDGKIVAAGISSNNDRDQPRAVVRYNRNGSLDRTFGGGDGTVTPDFTGSAKAVAVQPDGKIVAAGGSRGFALARFNPDGSPDTTFGEDGTVKTDNTTGNHEYANDLVLQPDGKLVVAGKLFNDFTLARYTPDGTLDETFGEDGTVTTDLGGEPGDSGSVYALALQSDNRIVAAGLRGVSPEGDSVLARYTPDGTLDTTFGEDGTVITGGRGLAYALVVQPDGKPIVAGSSGGDNFRDDFLLERYKPDGTLDTSFGGDGRVTTNFGGYDNAVDLVLQPDGKIVVAGDSNSENDNDFALARYNRNGTLDRSFGGDGRVTTDFRGYSNAGPLALQPSGRLVAAGGTYVRNNDSDFALARYTTE